MDNLPSHADVSILTSNISADFLNPPGVPSWDDRKQLYVQTLQQSGASLIGLQEVTPSQFDFLQKHLVDFTALTVSSDNPDPAMLSTWLSKYGKYGYHTIPTPYEIVLFYHAETYQHIDSGHWWLSPTPNRPSIGFGNTAPRVLLWTQLKHRSSQRPIMVFNTHIDHRCPNEMISLAREKFQPFIDQELPLIFMGDLNFNPTDSNYTLLMDDGWCDTHNVTPSEQSTFLYDMPDIPSGRIDYILYRGNGLKSVEWACLSSPDSARRLSDHDPVQAMLHLTL